MDKKFKYEKILNQNRPDSSKAHMSNRDRAAQFMPFAALTGFGAMINETSRTTCKKHQLNEDEITLLNENLNRIDENISQKPEVRITHFIPDKKKSGGKYETYSGNVRRIDSFEKEIIFTDKSKIKIENILLIEII